VRKPEQGTKPKLFYLGADEASLNPAMQERGDRYMFAEGSRIPSPGGANVAGGAAAVGGDGVDLLGMARTVYDVAHAERPWGWKVSTYLWTKSVAAGALLVAALAVIAGLSSVGPVAGLAAPLISLVFLALTTALLVFDLKRPERFLYLLLKPNWRSWLVWGGWILTAHGLLTVAWLAAGWAQNYAALFALGWPVLFVAAASAGYSAFLFGQAEGRDFWQSPLVLPHLLLAAVTAGCASLLLAALAVSGDPRVAEGLGLALWFSLAASAVVLFAEAFAAHANQEAARAARLIMRGPYRVRFWWGVVLGGTVVPLVLLLNPSFPATSGAAALMALGGLWLWEDIWVRAGQALPLS
jgi:formate-dependent nitrite reductase membrane component NrfD